MVSDFLRWVSKEDLKNRKIAKILESSIKSMIPECTVFEAFQKLKPDFVFPSFTKNDCENTKHVFNFRDFEIKKKCPFADDVFFVQAFRLYEDGSIHLAGMVSRFETKNGVFKLVIIQK
jgi:hypothetical protein